MGIKERLEQLKKDYPRDSMLATPVWLSLCIDEIVESISQMEKERQ